MKAVVLHEYGDLDQLRYEEAELPPVGENEVRVRVRAAGINPVDWKIRTGSAKERFPLHLPEILGRDLAGEVDEAGSAVVDFAKGMRVMGMAHRTYAEYAVAKADVLSPIPDGMSFEQAAALPVVVLTGAQLIERTLKLTSGQSVLITGALGGVGRVAVHVALAHGARVIAGVRSSRRDAAAKLGAERAVALDDEREMETVHDLDAVGDMVGGAMLTRIFNTLKDGGSYGSVIGLPKHPPERGIRVAAMMAAPDAPRLYELADEVARGLLTIPIAKVFPLSDVREATRLAETGGAGGKVVLIP